MTIMILSFLNCNIAAFAEPIKFEQGGASDSPGIVPAKKFQIEASLASYTSLNKNEDYDVTLGETLLRYGLITDRLEIRTRIFGLTFRDANVGIEKLSLGTKIGLLKEKGLVPNADLIVDFTIPIDNDVYPNNFSHLYNLTMDHQLGDRFTAVSNLILSFTGTRQAGDDFTRVQIPYVFGLNYELTRKISISEEVFGTWSLSGKQGNALGVATQLAYAFTDDLIGTLTVLSGLNDATDPVSINLGLVSRI